MKATTIKGLNKSVDIYTDAFGVPHVFAQNEEDLFYAAGYYAARDRLFQMSIVNFSVEENCLVHLAMNLLIVIYI